MKYKQNFFTGLSIYLLSCFAQWFNWFVFEKVDFDWKITLFTPLILCLMYHLVQVDAGKEDSFSRLYFFLFSVALPFLTGLIITVAIFLLNPDISNFNSETDYIGTVPEIICTYTGRLMFTSLYIAFFALIDIPVLKHFDKKGK